jgi:hypothetical protein
MNLEKLKRLTAPLIILEQINNGQMMAAQIPGVHSQSLVWLNCSINGVWG